MEKSDAVNQRSRSIRVSNLPIGKRWTYQAKVSNKDCLGYSSRPRRVKNDTIPLAFIFVRDYGPGRDVLPLRAVDPSCSPQWETFVLDAFNLDGLFAILAGCQYIDGFKGCRRVLVIVNDVRRRRLPAQMGYSCCGVVCRQQQRRQADPCQSNL